MRIKHCLAAWTALVLCLSLSGCSTEKQEHFVLDLFHLDRESESAGHVTVLEKDASVYLADPHLAFQKLTYTPETFYGKYSVREADNNILPDQAKSTFLENAKYNNITGTITRINAVPYRIDFGPHCNVTPLNYLSGYQWALMYFYDNHGEPVQVQAAYSVKENLLNFRLIRDFSFDSKAGVLDYTFSGNTLQYGYTLDQRGLVLSNADGAVTLVPMDLRGDTPEMNIYDAYAAEDSPLLDGIQMINITPESQYVQVDGVQCKISEYEADPSGLLRLKWNVGGEAHAVQTGFLYCDDDGLIMMDGENVYNYTHRSKDLYTKHITTNLRVADSDQLANLTDAEIEFLRTHVSELYNELEVAFEKAGVAAKVNKETGEVALDSVVLFEFDKYMISPEGEQMLRNFLRAYTSVIFSERFRGLVSEIAIEGHTDPTGLIEHNHVLSKARAEQVMAFCQSTNNGLDTETTAVLAPMLSAVGYAADHPIFDENGEVDYAASRRVSFRFVVNLDALNDQVTP